MRSGRADVDLRRRRWEYPMSTDVSVSLDSTQSAAADARGVVRRAYAGSLPAVTLGDLCLVVSELVANSSRHGPGGPIRLRLDSNGSGIAGRVDDEGSEWFSMGEITEDGGLGLQIVDALATAWEISPRGGSVSFVIRGRCIDASDAEQSGR